MAGASVSRHPCAACGFEVFARPVGSTETCPVCGWIDDLVQLAQPDFVVGPNAGLSLRQAQSRALAARPVGVRTFRGFARSSRWRPLSPAEYPASAPSGFASPVCYLVAPDPDTFEPYWLSPSPPPDREPVR